MTKENMRHVLRLDKKQTKNSWHYTLNACFIHPARIEGEPTEKEKKKTTMKVPFRISPGSWTGFVLLDEPNGPRLRRARDGDRPRVAQERIQGIETLPQIPGPRSAGQKKKREKKKRYLPRKRYTSSKSRQHTARYDFRRRVSPKMARRWVEDVVENIPIDAYASLVCLDFPLVSEKSSGVCGVLL